MNNYYCKDIDWVIIMKVVSFVNMKGGVGKTTLAVNIADFLTSRHAKKVLLIDVDPQFNATQCLINGDDYVEYIKNGGTTINILKNKTQVREMQSKAKTSGNMFSWNETIQKLVGEENE